jgi:hypothetical protein
MEFFIAFGRQLSMTILKAYEQERILILLPIIALFVVQTSVCLYAHIMLKHELRTLGVNAKMRPSEGEFPSRPWASLPFHGPAKAKKTPAVAKGWNPPLPPPRPSPASGSEDQYDSSRQSGTPEEPR